MRLFVGNLAWAATEEGLTDLFSQHGTVTSVKIMTDMNTGRSRGFAFVDMEDQAEAEAAIGALHDQDYLGRPLEINEARPKTGGNRFGGEGGGGGRREGGGGGGGWKGGGGGGYGGGGGDRDRDSRRY